MTKEKERWQCAKRDSTIGRMQIKLDAREDSLASPRGDISVEYFNLMVSSRFYWRSFACVINKFPDCIPTTLPGTQKNSDAPKSVRPMKKCQPAFFFFYGRFDQWPCARLTFLKYEKVDLQGRASRGNVAYGHFSNALAPDERERCCITHCTVAVPALSNLHYCEGTKRRMLSALRVWNTDSPKRELLHPGDVLQWGFLNSRRDKSSWKNKESSARLIPTQIPNWSKQFKERNHNYRDLCYWTKSLSKKQASCSKENLSSTYMVDPKLVR